MNRKSTSKKRRKFRALLNSRGIVWSEPSPGHFRIGDICYFYKAKKYRKGDSWVAFENHDQFIDSL